MSLGPPLLNSLRPKYLKTYCVHYIGKTATEFVFYWGERSLCQGYSFFRNLETRIISLGKQRKRDRNEGGGKRHIYLSVHPSIIYPARY
jgi:hypothetical protein